MKKYILNILIILALLLSMTTAVFAQEGTPNPSYPEAGNKVFLPMLGSSMNSGYQPAARPPLTDGLKLDEPMTMDNALARDFWGAQGPIRVSVELEGDPIVEIYKAEQEELVDPQVRLAELLAQQQAFIDNISAKYGAINLGGAQRLMNIVMVEVDASTIVDLAQEEGVVAVRPILEYELSLSDTVPYIGASAVQDMGYTGEGVTVAVIDSGIDYTHEAFGGEGMAAYDANDPAIIEEDTFPTARVVGGYDFVGQNWPNTVEEPDPDPLDKPTYNEGHGTHVADIIGGAQGVAPDVDLLALKACSSVSSACSGVALIQSMEYAVDPNGDGRLNDRVDVINMSLGSLYGNPFFDDLSVAVQQAAAVGVLSVVAAGNAADKPYIHDTPGSAPAAIGVAATHVPSDIIALMEVTAPTSIEGLYPAIWQDWSVPLADLYPTGVEAPLVYGDGAGGNLNGCAPFTVDLSGYIVLVDRGACNFTLKISNISQAGGLIGIIGLVTPEDPFVGADGGDRPIDIPGYMIYQADSTALKSGLPDTMVKFDPAVGVSQLGSMQSYSARGPSPWMNYIKPEIGAPASSTSAIAGTGTGTSAFGGTSGATPMVAGAAALLTEYTNAFIGAKHPDAPYAIKSLLVNNAETMIYDEPLDFFGGQLSPITRIGGGEVRVDRSIASPITLWEGGVEGMRLPTLSFGQVDVTGDLVLEKKVAVNNWTNQELVYDLSATFRYANDEDMGVMVEVFPEMLVVPPEKPGKVPEAGFIVKMTITGSELKDWVMNAGSNGNSGAALTYNEYDGYVWLDNVATTDDDAAMIHMPWHVLPRKSGDVMANPTTLSPADFEDDVAMVDFTNMGVQVAELDPYAWLAHSPDDVPAGVVGSQLHPVDIKDVGVMTYPVPAGFCSGSASFVMQFAITTYDRIALPVATPLFDIYLDVDQDGVYDYDVFNYPLGLNLNDGRSVVYVADLTTNQASAFFFLASGTNTANYVLPICGEQIGMNAANFFEPMYMDVLATDWYYSGEVTDYVLGLEISPLGERYVAFGDYVAPGATETWYVVDYGPVGTNPGELGVMFINGDAAAANENLTIPVSE